MSEGSTQDLEAQTTSSTGPRHSKLLGFIVILLGVAAIAAPLLTQLSMTIVAGWILIFAGIVRGVHAVMNRKEGGLLLGLGVSVLTFIVGGLILNNPIPSVLTLTLLLAILFIVEGLILIVRGFSKRLEIINWSTLVVNGFISGLLGVFILVNFPSSARWAIGLLLGIYLLLTGYTLMTQPSTEPDEDEDESPESAQMSG